MRVHLYILGFCALMSTAGMVDHSGSLFQGGIVFLMWLALIYGVWGFIRLIRFIKETAI